jgi:riboflavin transporter FmnP
MFFEMIKISPDIRIGGYFFFWRISMNKTVLRSLVVSALFGAVGFILMFIELGVPIMPSFIKFDFSELPALIAAFSLGPTSGVAVCLIKNVINLTMTTTGGVGELSNFLLGVCLVLPAGLIYKYRKNRRAAFLSALLGSFTMAAASLPLNYFLTYPMYSKIMPIEAIIGKYEEIFSGVNGLLSCLLIFNVPFTFFKGLVITLITFLIYKYISPIIKGNK